VSGTEEFGTRLHAHRYAAGLSQHELANRSGLSAKTIGNLERGQAKWPHPSSVLRLADALGLNGPEREEFTAAPGRRLSPPGEPAIPEEPAVRHETPRTPQPGMASAITAAGYRHGLPPDTAAFTGRAPELGLITQVAAVAAAGGPGGALAIRTIGGMPGVGKTALAVRAAHLLAGAFPDRQLFIDLYGHTPGHDPVRPADALAGLLAATGVDPGLLPADLAGRAMLWRDKMAGQRALLVLDNAASSAQVTPLLPAGDCLVLVTSRRQLADLPGAVLPVPVETLPPCQAREMFTRLAPRAADEDPALVGELAGLAGCLPLAVTLLARVYTQHPSWTLDDLIAETRGSLLTMTAEHASVAAAFEASWRSLDPAALRLLALLGLNPSTSTDGYAAAALAGCTVAEAARLLDGLHREGLLTETAYRRYRMHDLIRAYAAAQAHVTIDTSVRQQAVTRLRGPYTRTGTSADAVMTGEPKTPAGNVRPPAAAVTPQPSASAGTAAGASTMRLPAAESAARKVESNKND